MFMSVVPRFSFLILPVVMTGVLLCAPIAQAEEPRIAPLHIKVGKMHKAPGSKIRIYKGQFPKDLSLATSDKSPLVSLRGGSVMAGESEADSALSCLMSRTEPMGENRIQNMADSLRTSLRVEKRDPKLVDILLNVSQKTDTDFELLVLKAMLESDMGRQMASPVSTARGVFQYIETTWLSLMQRYGARIGHSDYADAIEINLRTGQPEIKKSSAVSRADILRLRFDPYTAAMIKAYQIKDETNVVAAFKDGESLTATDHYIAHMMGLSLAKEFYKLKNQESGQILAFSSNPLFREAVALNPAFFYDEKHRGLTAVQAYQHFKNRLAATYGRLRKIEVEYGQDKTITADCNSMPAVRAANVEKPDMLETKGLALASSVMN